MNQHAISPSMNPVATVVLALDQMSVKQLFFARLIYTINWIQDNSRRDHCDLEIIPGLLHCGFACSSLIGNPTMTYLTGMR